VGDDEVAEYDFVEGDRGLVDELDRRTLLTRALPRSDRPATPGSGSPAGPIPDGLRPLSQVSALNVSPRALRVPYRDRMGKRDALVHSTFRLTADVRRATIS
jgi:hypothetical protein